MDRKITGFSILEVLIVIAILSILMAVAISYYVKYKKDRELTTQTNNLLNELSWLKSQSIAKEPHGIVVNINSYTLFKDLNGDCNYNDDEVIRIINFTEGITSTASQTIVFDRKGYPRDTNCALGTTEGTITLKNTNNNQKKIRISRYGRTRIE